LVAAFIVLIVIVLTSFLVQNYGQPPTFSVGDFGG
jgi:hypothetical protein